jgi:hypothetical protein
VSQSSQPGLATEQTPRLVSCSPTKLATWVDCPRRFLYAYVDRPMPKKGPPWAHLSYGTSAHNALRGWWELPPDERRPPTAGELVRSGWLTDGFRDEDQCSQWREIAAGQVTSYVTGVDPRTEPRGLERTVAMKTSVLAFSGRVDRIDERDGELVIVDYKLGRSVPSDTDVRASMAMALYAKASQQMFRAPCLRVELHHLPSGRAAAWHHTDESVARHVGRAEGIGSEILQSLAGLDAADEDERDSVADDLFPTKAGSLCGWCDFRGACEDGQAAAPARNPWDGLTDPSAR